MASGDFSVPEQIPTGSPSAITVSSTLRTGKCPFSGETPATANNPKSAVDLKTVSKKILLSY